jgi:hypothetical protein
LEATSSAFKSPKQIPSNLNWNKKTHPYMAVFNYISLHVMEGTTLPEEEDHQLFHGHKFMLRSHTSTPKKLIKKKIVNFFWLLEDSRFHPKNRYLL